MAALFPIRKKRISNYEYSCFINDTKYKSVLWLDQVQLIPTSPTPINQQDNYDNQQDDDDDHQYNYDGNIWKTNFRNFNQSYRFIAAT
jgi:hypothetical protein